MKKALLLTDCSEESALSLSGWMASHPQKILDLTVVHTYILAPIPADLLKASLYTAAKAEAGRQLNQWLDFLPYLWPGKLQTETLLGDASLALTIHLLLRQYDYFLLDASQEDMRAVYMACQNQIRTELHCLTPVENQRSSPHLALVDQYRSLNAA